MDVMDAIHLPRAIRHALFGLLTSLAVSTAWGADPKVPFNIPAGALSETIVEFSKQSKIEVLYATVNGVKEIKTPTVVGELEVPEALARLLEGTGFTFTFESDRSVLVSRERKGSSSHAALTGPETAAVTMPSQNLDEVAEVVVTGSFIHGLKDIVSPLVLITNKDKKHAAFGTVQDVLSTLPFNFGGGPSEDFSLSANFNRGSSVNLRGLGSGATLVLVNGRRQPVSGVEGDFVDVSSIPLSAVKRIEILSDGASALYGSDAIAGVVNIIMRDDLSGGESQIRLGEAFGGADEVQIAQLFGHRSDTGNFLFSYQYSERTALGAAEREYSANADKRKFGGSDLRTTSSNPGNILDPMTLRPVFAIPAGQDGKSLSVSDLLVDSINRQNQNQNLDLLPDRRTHSAFFTASQKLGSHLEVFAEGRYSNQHIAATERSYEQLLVVPPTNPYFIDPFGGSPLVVVAYNFSNEFGPVTYSGETNVYTSTLGIKADLNDRWRATLSGFRGKESMRWVGRNLVDFLALDERLNDSNPDTAFNPFGAGSNSSKEVLDAIRVTQHERAVSKLSTLSLVTDGSLPSLFTGTPKLALGIDYRKESLNRDLTHVQYDRHVSATFAEFSLPLLPGLNLSLASRYETYSDFGDTFNPKVGLRWEPNKSLRLRGSWGSSFRAPTLVDLYDRSLDAAAVFPLADPHSENGFSVVLLQQGSNADLHEETATTWTVGIDLAPAAMPGFTLTSTYYVIDYEDRVWRYSPTIPLESLIAVDEWQSLVTRNPSQSQIDGICSSPTFFGSASECIASAPTVILDLRIRNLSATTVKGMDVELKQLSNTDHGSVTFGLAGSYLFEFGQAITQDGPVIDLAGTTFNPSVLRLRGLAEWDQRGPNSPGFGAGVVMEYLDSAGDYESSPTRRVSSWMTFDFQLRYRTGQNAQWLSNMDFVLNAANVFDRDPPFVNRVSGYDPANAEPVGRVISFSAQKNW